MYPTAGVYDVKLVVSNNHSTDTLLKEDYITVLPVSNLSEKGTIVTPIIFPNPAKEKIYISGIKTGSSISVYTCEGKQVRLIEQKSAIPLIDISLNDLQPGAYFVNIQWDNQQITEKIFIN